MNDGQGIKRLLWYTCPSTSPVKLHIEGWETLSGNKLWREGTYADHNHFSFWRSNPYVFLSCSYVNPMLNVSTWCGFEQPMILHLASTWLVCVGMVSTSCVQWWMKMDGVGVWWVHSLASFLTRFGRASNSIDNGIHAWNRWTMKWKELYHNMTMSTNRFVGGAAAAAAAAEEQEEGCAILHTRDVSLLSSLSSYDNDDEHHHQQHHRAAASPLRSPPFLHSSQTKSLLDLPHLDYHSSRRMNTLPSSSSHSSSFLDSKCRNNTNNNIVHRRFTSSNFLKKKNLSDKKVKAKEDGNGTAPKLVSASSLPMISSPNATDDNNDETTSLCSVPHLMRTRDSQDEEEDDDDDEGVANDYFNGDSDLDDEDDDDNYYSNLHRASSIINNKSIEIVITNDLDNKHDDNGFGTESSSTTLLAFSLPSSLTHQQQPSHLPSETPTVDSSFTQQPQPPLQQLHQPLPPPPPPQNNTSPLSTTPIVCNRRQKLQFHSNVVDPTNNNSMNNIFRSSNNRSGNSSVHNEHNSSRSRNDNSRSNNSNNNNYVIIFPGENNSDIEVASSSLPTLPL